MAEIFGRFSLYFPLLGHLNLINVIERQCSPKYFSNDNESSSNMQKMKWYCTWNEKCYYRDNEFRF